MILSGNDIHLNDLILLFEQCQSTLNRLRLRFKIGYIVDGYLLETLKKRLKEFDFYLFCYSIDKYCSDDLLSSFQSPIWMKDQLVMFFSNSYYKTLTIISPPNHCRSLNCSITNEFLNYRLNNSNEQLKMSKMKRIFLNDKQKPLYNNQFFYSFKSIFVNLEIIEIGSHFHLIDNDENSLSRKDWKLSSVNTLIIVNNDNYLNLQCLLKLFPNLVRLVIDYHLLCNYLNDSYSIDQQYDQLKEMLIHFKPNEHIYLNDQFKQRIQFTFQNAQILS